MGNSCPRCGGPTKETDVFCGKCGLNLSQQPARAASGQRPRGKGNLLRKSANAVMQYIAFILIAMLVFTLVLGILNFTAKHKVDVAAIAEYGDERQEEVQTMTLEEVYEAEEFIGLAISGLAYGVFNLILSAYAGYVIFWRFRGGKKIKAMVKNYALTGLAGNVIYLLLFWILGTHKEVYSKITMKAVVSPHFTVWIAIVLFALLLAAAMLSRSKRRRK